MSINCRNDNGNPNNRRIQIRWDGQTYIKPNLYKNRVELAGALNGCFWSSAHHWTSVWIWED
jgi:hypothetical protein